MRLKLSILQLITSVTNSQPSQSSQGIYVFAWKSVAGTHMEMNFFGKKYSIFCFLFNWLSDYSECKYMNIQHAPTCGNSCNHMTHGVMQVNRCHDCNPGHPLDCCSCALTWSMHLIIFVNNAMRSTGTTLWTWKRLHRRAILALPFFSEWDQNQSLWYWVIWYSYYICHFWIFFIKVPLPSTCNHIIILWYFLEDRRSYPRKLMLFMISWHFHDTSWDGIGMNWQGSEKTVRYLIHWSKSSPTAPLWVSKLIFIYASCMMMRKWLWRHWIGSWKYYYMKSYLYLLPCSLYRWTVHTLVRGVLKHRTMLHH